MGYPDIPVLVTRGPVVFRTPADVRARVDGLLEDVLRSLCGPPEGAA